MIQTLWFFLQTALVVIAAIWLVMQPGSVAMNLMGYKLTIQVGVFFLLLVIAVLIIFFVLRVVRGILSVPKIIVKYNEEDKRKKGYRALTRGFVALAAGDIKKASYFSKRTRSLWPDQRGLPVLLEAQTARLRGEEGLAQNRFEELMKDKDTAFLGIRGLLKSALEEGYIDRALDFARQALKLHSKQGWVLKTVYDLELRNHLWSDALITGKRAIKIGAISQERSESDRVAIHIMRYEHEKDNGNSKAALKELEQAYKLNSFFVPTVTRLAYAYIERKKMRKAANIIEKVWRQTPHPELAVLWDCLAPQANEKNEDKRIKWYENLVSFKPASAEGQMTAARAAMGMGHWGEAKAYLMMAEKIYPSARLFRLRAIVEQNSTHNEDAIHQLMEKASEALPDKVWVCQETGLIYDEWLPIAMPHESFNTIIWDYAGARVIKNESVSFIDSHADLLIDPAA